jgi:propionyl-CoA carboxylase alpha chain
MIRRLLIANRGEIARRIMRTCRDLDVATVAVCAGPDVGAAFVREADAVVRLPGATPAETYLCVDRLVEAARTAGADAVHPGYGFLSESAAFAEAVTDAGLRWVGPPAAAIRTMGSKLEAKALMAKAGVSVLEELRVADVTPSHLPVLVKASAGGGGRGMRVVRELDALDEELAAAQREAASAFGDPSVFCEPYLERGRHIEVQVLADADGTVWSLGERECSAQRRHQKVLEEAPSPLVDDAMRERLGAAARDATRAVDYVGAGTVEFLADGEGRFYFLEMNTRLQVEHPVTECCTGLDLVAEQLRIAEGGTLEGDPPPLAGHAIEARLYAEDPAAGWSARSGTLHRLEVPGVAARFAIPAGAGLRLDSAVDGGEEISTHYDPMLAKVIAWAPTREEAARRLAGGLAGAHLHGPATNRDLLVRLLRHPVFLDGEVDTGFLERDGADLARPLADERTRRLCAVAAAVAATEEGRQAAPLPAAPPGWRNLASQPERHTFLVDDDELEVALWRTRDGAEVEGLDEVRLVHATPTGVVLADGGVERRFAVARYDDEVFVDSSLGAVRLRPLPRFPDPRAQVAVGSLVAPMPGTVVQVPVVEGQAVTAGEPVVVLEAMKMEHTVRAPDDGAVAGVMVRVGDQVERGDVLAVVDTEGEDTEVEEAT